MFSLESPQGGDSNEYTQYTIFQYEKANNPKLSQICNYGICSKGPKNEFEPAVVNEPSGFKPLKFYCNSLTTVCPPVQGDNPRALASGLFPVQVDKPSYNYFIPPSSV